MGRTCSAIAHLEGRPGDVQGTSPCHVARRSLNVRAVATSAPPRLVAGWCSSVRSARSGTGSPVATRTPLTRSCWARCRHRTLHHHRLVVGERSPKRFLLRPMRGRPLSQTQRRPRRRRVTCRGRPHRRRRIQRRSERRSRAGWVAWRRTVDERRRQADLGDRRAEGPAGLWCTNQAQAHPAGSTGAGVAHFGGWR